jgi:hypothetical protein
VSKQQCVAIRRSLRDRSGTDGATGAGPIVDDELCMHGLGQFGGDHARHRVDATAWRIRHDQRDGTRRVVGGRGTHRRQHRGKQ